MSTVLPRYPRQVSYKTQNFLDKNRDFVVAEHEALMQASSEPFTHLLFPSDPDAVRAAAFTSTSTVTCAKIDAGPSTPLASAKLFSVRAGADALSHLHHPTFPAANHVRLSQLL